MESPLLTDRQRTLLEVAGAIDDEDAASADALGFMARVFAQATLPHSDPQLPPGTLYRRDTGRLVLTISPTDTDYGIPFGSVPRFLLAWLCTEVRRTREPVLSLGHSQAEFLQRVNLRSCGTDIRRFKEQSMRLFRSVITVRYGDTAHGGEEWETIRVAARGQVFWHPHDPSHRSAWKSSLELSNEFFRGLLEHSVPIDMRALRALGKSPMAMDVYTWLTYRLYVLQRARTPRAQVPWVALQRQFGAGYAITPEGTRDFKKGFRHALKKVLALYQAAQGHISETSNCLVLTPGASHVRSRSQPSPLRRAA